MHAYAAIQATVAAQDEGRTLACSNGAEKLHSTAERACMESMPPTSTAGAANRSISDMYRSALRPLALGRKMCTV
jgi:hypothetical protein